MMKNIERKNGVESHKTHLSTQTSFSSSPAMLAQLKSKPQDDDNSVGSESVEGPGAAAAQQLSSEPSSTLLSLDEKNDTQVTCDVLCSLSAAYPQGPLAPCSDSSSNTGVSEKRKSKSCPKQHQLPLFLSSTFI
jgi:hypothetical protein